ncbi:hypothetical protein [Alteribacillus bidgolensis]|uniref:PLD-like domain-containing protein n=1 Tax=Alteribacillus bidgolensis TaxID=930129 RepID=A0A1G8Q7G3_9BACI|nr:hypothetical protein [Alteribacillus bidgolensis]SDJ00704.1 hypothetical protein SAMN05216352_11832 [Alteribacillus bidgolensis]
MFSEMEDENNFTIEIKDAKVVFTQGTDNFEEILSTSTRNKHLYLTTFNYGLPENYDSWIKKDIEYINEIIVVFNNREKNVDNLIRRSLRKNPYIQFFYNEVNHSKVISNGSSLYIGSANLTDFSKDNFEAGVIVKDVDKIKQIEDRVFKNAHLKYEPIFTDPVSPLIVPFLLIYREVEKEFKYIKHLLNDIKRIEGLSEEDIPDDGDELCTYISKYIEIFRLAKDDLISYATEKTEEYFVIQNLLEEIEDKLNYVKNKQPIGSSTISLLEFLEDYYNALDKYKEHFWRINTFDSDVTLLEEQIYFKEVENIFQRLNHLRIKWISLIKSNTYIKYRNSKSPIIFWLEFPSQAKKYWQYFLR